MQAANKKMMMINVKANLKVTRIIWPLITEMTLNIEKSLVILKSFRYMSSIIYLSVITLKAMSAVGIRDK